MSEPDPDDIGAGQDAMDDVDTSTDEVAAAEDAQAAEDAGDDDD